MTCIHRTTMLMGALLLSMVAAPHVVTAAELTVADVELVSGLKNVKEVAKGSIPGAGGNVNFARADGTLLVLVTIAASSDYSEAVKMFDKRTQVSGVGEEAFIPADAPWALYARSGSKFVGIGGGLDPKSGMPILSTAQIQQLAKIVFSRL